MSLSSGAGRAGKEEPANGSPSTSVTLKFEPKFFFMELDAGICSKLCKNLQDALTSEHSPSRWISFKEDEIAQ